MKVRLDVGALTVEQFLATAERVVTANPERVNPRATTGGDCLYQKVLSDATVERCLIGHILLEELGIEYDRHWETTTARSIMDDMGFSRDVITVANDLQSIADTDFRKPSVTWSEAWRRFREDPRPPLF